MSYFFLVNISRVTVYNSAESTWFLESELSGFLVVHYWKTSRSFIIRQREHPSLTWVFWRRSELAQLMPTTVLDSVKKLKTANGSFSTQLILVCPS